MTLNLKRFKDDLNSLLQRGNNLEYAMLRSLGKDSFESLVKERMGDAAGDFLKDLPSFEKAYQSWYSEALVVVKQLLPDRIDDFRRHYEKPKGRKEITYENYRIEDYLQGLTVTRTTGYEKEVVADQKAALPHFRQQIAILEAAKRRLESSLFEMRQLVQADLFDSELDAARELLRNKFVRAAGAMVGVLLEKHLAQVCDNHSIRVTQKNPSIADLNEALKKADVTEISQWRNIQHLADLRNLCDHNKKVEPTGDQVSDLISGVAKIMKTVS